MQDKFEAHSAETQPKEKKNGLSVFRSILAGSVTGAFEVLVDHPLWSIKTRLQNDAPFTLNPRILYKGILPNAASMIPITAVQVGLNSFFQKWFFDSRYALSNSQQMASAFAAGVGSALISCPTEMVMTHQRASFLSTGRYLFQQGGMPRLYTGMMATMLREGMFSTFFLAVTPLLKDNFRQYCPNDYAASLLAGMLAGIGATLASQGFDVVKSKQQSYATANPAGFFKTTQTLYASHGAYGFFKGSLPRGLRVMSAVTLMSWMNEKMAEILAQNRVEEADSPSEMTRRPG
ncbi:Mitochondrial carrier protein [Legionella massiliensis]|uniref:Mitochondrial carrier protein n=1 Tax=Legionella massiliensis TaxID=1034943 RepID=A0A078L123_9GAMM|nr:MC/SLC25 family protein [Legionella massiliensis]CDZ77763.1 Mitochondrial carrier protein [Legionella massiliensis]CEE13501.1 Mitochondrial carrier protein [Legionella massiliensis]